MIRTILWPLAAILATLFANVAFAKDEVRPKRDEKKATPANESEFAKQHKQFVAAINKADKTALLEGLPSEWEHGLLAEELKTKKTVKHFKYPFYSNPLPLTEKDKKALLALAVAKNSLPELLEEHLCGGFHPDYCIEWHVGKDIYYCLICFGCHEAELYGPKIVLHCDLPDAAYDSFKKILMQYRRERPESKSKESK